MSPCTARKSSSASRRMTRPPTAPVYRRSNDPLNYAAGFAAISRIRFRSRSDAREAEGAPLLREYGVKSSIEGSNPSVSARFKCTRSKVVIAKHAVDLHNSASAPVAQLDRAPGYELGGREFESLRARHANKKADGKPSAFLFA